jgi:hypothetical protein
VRAAPIHQEADTNLLRRPAITLMAPQGDASCYDASGSNDGILLNIDPQGTQTTSSIRRISERQRASRKTSRSPRDDRMGGCPFISRYETSPSLVEGVLLRHDDAGPCSIISTHSHSLFLTCRQLTLSTIRQCYSSCSDVSLVSTVMSTKRLRGTVRWFIKGF